MHYKNKNIILISIFILILILSYEFSISNTLSLKNDYNVLKKEISLHDGIPKQLNLLKNKNAYYDSLLVVNKIDGGSIQNTLLKVINNFSIENSVKVIEFNAPHEFHQDNRIITTYDFTLQGNYNQIQTLMHHLEQNTKLGEIVNLHFKKQKNFKTGSFFLQTRILLSSIN